MVRGLIKYGISNLVEWTIAETSTAIAEAFAKGTADGMARAGIEITAQVQLLAAPTCTNKAETERVEQTSLPFIAPPATLPSGDVKPTAEKRKRGRPRKFTNYETDQSIH